jgi:DNA-binding IclR family transcriptional regulator
MPKHDAPPIKATSVSFDVLETIHEHNGVTLPELVDQIQKPKSTIHDHVRTLNELGYLLKEGRTFRVSVRFLKLGGLARARSRFFQVGKEEVRKLADETGEHANLLVEEDGIGIFLYKEKGPESVNLDTYEGMEVYLHTTALGKSILAEMDKSRRDDIINEHGLEKITNNTITDREELEDELKTIREQGYAVDNEERIDGIRCIAASVATENGVVGAVSISAPRRRMKGNRFEQEIPDEVLSTANIIEVNIQYS